MASIESFSELVSRMEQLLVALKALGWGGADVEAEFEGVTRSSLEKRFAELVASSEIDFATADEILNEMVELREEAINARNAALLSRGVFSSTAEALSYGVASLASLVGGSGGTDGIFDLAFSSGGGADAAGRFVVAGGSVVSYIITATGRNFTYTPSVSFAASAGLTGASATPVIATNVSVGEFFCTPAPGAFLQLYRVDAGLVATAVGDPYPRMVAIADLQSRAIQRASTQVSTPFAILGRRTGRKYLWITTDESGANPELQMPGLNLTSSLNHAIQAGPKTIELPDTDNPVIFAVLSPKGRIVFIKSLNDTGPAVDAQSFGWREQYATDVERLSAAEFAPFSSEHVAVSSEVTHWSGRSAFNDQRIPSLEYNTATATLHLACEARTGGDYDYTVIAYRRKLTGGAWQPAETILISDPAATGLSQAPCFVFDPVIGRLWLHWKWLPQATADIASREVAPARCYEPRAIYSDDDGVTWKGASGAAWVPGTSTQASAISLSYLKPASWYRWATLSKGIVLDDSTLVVPAWGRIDTDGSSNSCAFVLYYDRHETNPDLAWKRSATTDLSVPVTETCVYANRDGSLTLNSRPASGDYRVETKSVGETGADRWTWQLPKVRTDLPDPRCAGSAVRLAPLDWPYNRTLFVNCAITYSEDGGHRHKLTARLSYDDLATFAKTVQFYPTLQTITHDSYGNVLAVPISGYEMLFGYSCLTRMTGDKFAMAFERADIDTDGSIHLYRVIDVAILDLKFLLGATL